MAETQPRGAQLMHADEIALELQKSLPQVGFTADPLVILRIDEGQVVTITGMNLRVYLVDAEAQRNRAAMRQSGSQWSRSGWILLCWPRV